ncbi:MAG: M14 family metallopeptidase [Gammaproteobacteria bacterium]|jgi:succinylglutamate desuccinylase
MGSLLNQYHALPAGLPDAAPDRLADLLGGPALIHLPGRRAQPLFVSVLLHGNETTGFRALQGLLRRYRSRELPRALSFFVGNVEAARDGLRRLAGQPDYNRVWPGSDYSDSAEKRMMTEIVDIMRARRPFASIDVHNNTGINPHYACINRIDHRFMHLGSLFSRTLVYFIRPAGVQSMAFAELCPSVTVECGKVEQLAGEEHALEFLDACLHLSRIPEHPVAAHDVDLFHTVATVRVPPAYSFGFGNKAVDICFVNNLDHLNFRELPSGTALAHLDGIEALPLEAVDEQGCEVAGRFFRVEDNVLRTARALMPSMLTLDERVIRQDCLGYLMERYPLPA